MVDQFSDVDMGVRCLVTFCCEHSPGTLKWILGFYPVYLSGNNALILAFIPGMNEHWLAQCQIANNNLEEQSHGRYKDLCRVILGQKPRTSQPLDLSISQGLYVLEKSCLQIAGGSDDNWMARGTTDTSHPVLKHLALSTTYQDTLRSTCIGAEKMHLELIHGVRCEKVIVQDMFGSKKAYLARLAQLKNQDDGIVRHLVFVTNYMAVSIGLKLTCLLLQFQESQNELATLKKSIEVNKSVTTAEAALLARVNSLTHHIAEIRDEIDALVEEKANPFMGVAEFTAVPTVVDALFAARLRSGEIQSFVVLAPEVQLDLWSGNLSLPEVTAMVFARINPTDRLTFMPNEPTEKRCFSFFGKFKECFHITRNTKKIPGDLVDPSFHCKCFWGKKNHLCYESIAYSLLDDSFKLPPFFIAEQEAKQKVAEANKRLKRSKESVDAETKEYRFMDAFRKVDS